MEKSKVNRECSEILCENIVEVEKGTRNPICSECDKKQGEMLKKLELDSKFGQEHYLTLKVRVGKYISSKENINLKIRAFSDYEAVQKLGNVLQKLLDKG